MSIIIRLPCCVRPKFAGAEDAEGEAAAVVEGFGGGCDSYHVVADGDWSTGLAGADEELDRVAAAKADDQFLSGVQALEAKRLGERDEGAAARPSVILT